MRSPLLRELQGKRTHKHHTSLARRRHALTVLDAPSEGGLRTNRHRRQGALAVTPPRPRHLHHLLHFHPIISLRRRLPASIMTTFPATNVNREPSGD
jgi:hypothetical protein